MALDPNVIALLRIEVGDDSDFSDNDPHLSGQLGSLEEFYTNIYIGNSNILRTALAVWRKRRSVYVLRSADASTSGELINRSQRMRELNRQVKRYEILVETTLRAQNDDVLSNYQANEDAGAEY